MTEVHFSRHSDLAVPAERMLATLNMGGVNQELMPLVRMTAPTPWRDTPIVDWPVGQPLFHSWILLFGFLPIDRHAFLMAEIIPGAGFRETSSSWMNRVWSHQRTVEPVTGGCRVIDNVSFATRLGPLAPLQRPIIEHIFDHRHHVLRQQFGVLNADDA